MLNFSLQSRYFASSLRTGSIFARLRPVFSGLFPQQRLEIEPTLRNNNLESWTTNDPTPGSIRYRVNICLQIPMRFLSEMNREQSHHAPLCYSSKKSWGVYFVVTSNIQHFRVVFLKRPFRPSAVRPDLSQFARSAFVFL